MTFRERLARMSDTTRATVYLDARLHRALRLKSAETDRTISDLVNDAVRSALAEDAEDLAVIADRRSEPARAFESFVKDLRRRGRL
jgi:hypothetical protein